MLGKQKKVRLIPAVKFKEGFPMKTEICGFFKGFFKKLFERESVCA